MKILSACLFFVASSLGAMSWQDAQNAELLTPVVKNWIESQSKVLKSQDLSTPPQRLEALVNHVFVTHHISSDRTIRPSDWGHVTGDGASLDPWELTHQLYFLGKSLGWSIQIAEVGLGPVILMGQGEQRVGSLVHHGKEGRWSRWYPNQDLPKSLTQESWAHVLNYRRAILEAGVGKAEALKKLSKFPVPLEITPTIALGILMRGDTLKLETLVDWSTRWPEVSEFTYHLLQLARQKKSTEIFEKTWQGISDNRKTPDILLEGVLWSHATGAHDNAKERLKQLLSRNPYHARGLMLQKAWE